MPNDENHLNLKTVNYFTAHFLLENTEDHGLGCMKILMNRELSEFSYENVKNVKEPFMGLVQIWQIIFIAKKWWESFENVETFCFEIFKQNDLIFHSEMVYGHWTMVIPDNLFELIN